MNEKNTDILSYNIRQPVDVTCDCFQWLLVFTLLHLLLVLVSASLPLLFQLTKREDKSVENNNF